MLRNHAEATSADEPLATMATARHHGVTVPPGAFIQKHHGGLNYQAIGHMTKDVAEPFAGVVARTNLSLVIPYRKAKTKTTDEPLLTQATVEGAGLASAPITRHRHQRLPLPDGQAARVRPRAALPRLLPDHRQRRRAANAGRERGQQQRQPVARRSHGRGPVMNEDLATPEQTAELRGEALVWQMLLHQASAQLSNLAAYSARHAAALNARHRRRTHSLGREAAARPRRRPGPQAGRRRARPVGAAPPAARGA